VRRRSLFAALVAGGTVGLAGCTLGGGGTVGKGDVVELDAGRVTLGALDVQSSFVDDTAAPPTVHGERGVGYVVLACDCREYGAPANDLPFAVELAGERVADAADALVSGAGDGRPRIAFPVPAGDALDSRRSTESGNASDSWAVVVTDAEGRERRYGFDDGLRRQLSAPPAWRVTVDPPDAMPDAGTTRAWATASNTGDVPGRLAAVLAHDAAEDLYWRHEFDVDANGESTFGYRFACLCGDRDELALTLDWGRDSWRGTVPVDT